MSLRHLIGPRAGALAIAAVAATATTAALLPPLTASAATPAVTAVTEDGYDTAPAEAAAAWLTAQLAEGDGVLQTSFGPNTSATVDAGRSFYYAGDDEAVAAVTDAVEPLAASYTGDNGFGTLVSAGGTAKLLTLVQYAGGDASSYGGVDLVQRLEGQVTIDGPAEGRIFDDFDPENEFAADYANGFGQAFAVEALSNAGSDLAPLATEFLLQQQCADGGFRLYFSDPAAADQSCDAAGGEGSTDVTALAILALLDQAAEDERNQDAILAAVDFLATTQGDDGAWGDGGEIGANANSTGLAALALGVLGGIDGNPADIGFEPEAAAAWLRQHQVNEIASCRSELNGEQGALAYDDAALAAGRTDGITEDTTYQWQLANAQAFPALQWALAAEGRPGMRADSGRQRSGGTMSVLVAGLAPGETGCLVGGQQPVFVTADLDGQTTATVRVPVGTALRNLYLGTTGRSSVKISYWSLAAKRFGLTSTATVRQNGQVAVKVSGLAPGEPFTLSYHGRVRGTGKADANGRASFAFRGGSTLGRWEFAIVGQYADRFVKSTFTVVK